MAVPTRPSSGAPIESTWGGIVHDGHVALDWQGGIVVGAIAASGVYQDFAVTFPRPYASAPVVVACISGTFAGVQDYVVAAINVLTTSCAIRISKKSGATMSAIASAPLASWVAVGPRV